MHNESSVHVTQHLNFLLGTFEQSVAGSDSYREIKDHPQNSRTRLSDISLATADETAVGAQDQDDFTTILDVFRFNENAPLHPLVFKIHQKLHDRVLLESLLGILSSNRPNDSISGEVAEVVGFDNMDLVMDILNQRNILKAELDRYISNDPETIPEPQKHQPILDNLQNLSSEKARNRMENLFRKNAARPPLLMSSEEAEILPNVYSTSSIAQGNILSQFGSKYMMPLGTTRNMHEDYEEVVIPPPKQVAPKQSERLVLIAELDEIAKGCFPGYSSLNRMQSIVYPTAYKSNENMLICAPTGAGKTDVAMLTILRVIKQHRSNGHIPPTNRDSFKIIYVAPMKALASEIVRKLGKRLRWLNIKVRELTGDMQLTKAEISETQIIVTTPEKWDVVTRKPTGEGELASSLKLLIIDEVHLLNEERGAVIETIVARTLRQVETNQSMIRIVGLSATLPNYLDVAEFLSVSRFKGLFFFDSSFRPVPLEQHFLGVKGKTGSAQFRRNLDKVTFQKVSELVDQGHQVMVFVHARKETVKTAMGLQEMSVLEGNSEIFSCEDHPQWNLFRRDISESRNKEMKLLFQTGFGIHHAGMLRTDRNLTEKLFEAKAIKVLCCTATLAWGVNLPAHAVIIKGTQVYDSSRGSFVDLSVLDVLQVFGRAGRPGYETSGEGYICTTEDKLAHYLEAVNSQLPIESQFRRGMIDALNAEIALGTVANTQDAVQWLGYTYLFVRMRKNPFVYGIDRDAPLEDPQLSSKRLELVVSAAQNLAAARMIVFDRNTGGFSITDLGRIAAKYYIRHASIQIYNELMRPKMSEADVLAMLSRSTEFDQIQVRETEVKELEQLQERIPCEVKGGPDTSQGKVNILLQAYISRESVDDFALVSDMAYAAQNGGRIIRALLEIAMSRKWAFITGVLLGMSKAVEKRLWPFEHPFVQFQLKADVLYNIQEWAEGLDVSQLATMDATSLGTLVHMNEHHGKAILDVAKQFPAVQLEYDLKPLGDSVLKLVVHTGRAFTWNTRTHDNAEPFWLWVEDPTGLNIYHLYHLSFRQTSEALDVVFIIPISNEKPPPFVTLRWVSDKWLGAEDEITIPLDSLIMPAKSQCHTAKLDLPYLSINALGNKTLEGVFGNTIRNFNSIQTQVFWGLLNTKWHCLLCSPSGGGKSTMAQIVAWMTAIQVPNAWVIVVTPRQSVAVETLSGYMRASGITGISVELAREQNVLSRSPGKKIRIVTASHLYKAVSKKVSTISDIDLVICENLELFDSTYELGVSLLRHATQSSPTRFIGISSSLDDPADLADWLDVDPSAIFSFRPQHREQSLIFSQQSFSIPYSTALLKAMAKPSHDAIMRVPAGEAAVIFVPSRGSCQMVAHDLITQCALYTGVATGYLPANLDEIRLEIYCVQLRDRSLVDFVMKGVGFFHAGIQQSDQKLILQLFLEGVIRVLIVPRDSCWSLPIRASTVVVMGTQYISIRADGSDRQVRDYSLTELVHMQGRAVRHVGTGHFHLFSQSETLEYFTKFLNEGLPLESQLRDDQSLLLWYQSQKWKDNLSKKQQILDALSFTFLSRRIVSNPTYYSFRSDSRDENLSRIVDELTSSTDTS